MADDISSYSPSGGRSLKEDSTVVNIADKSEEYLGGKGFVVICDSNPHVPGAGLCWVELDFIQDTIIADYIVDSSAPITGTIKSVQFDKGSVVCGKFVSLTLTSGAVLAYNGRLT
jgi:hypothetical protein